MIQESVCACESLAYNCGGREQGSNGGDGGEGEGGRQGRIRTLLEWPRGEGERDERGWAGID